MKKFWLYFSSVYGTIWFVIQAFSKITHTKIDIGEIGMFTLIAIAIIYGYVKFRIDFKKSKY
ncbi:hypothetical protein [Dokdonia sp.]|uniref:hypothetical protein n=1 Tax=Dokdonia sp. TaxID=2024995 RepID=UPI0032678598